MLHACLWLLKAKVISPMTGTMNGHGHVFCARHEVMTLTLSPFSGDRITETRIL